MDLIERLQDFEQSCDQLFSQVDERISFLNSAISNMKQRVLNVQEQVANMTSDRNRATRLYSPLSYPSNSDTELKIEPISFALSNLNSSQSSTKQRETLSNINDDQLDLFTKRSLDQVNEITAPILSNSKPGTILNPLRGIKSVSSLLVYHSYENRLIHQASILNKKVKSKTSDSSIHDYAASKSNKLRGNSSFHDRNVINKSSSGGESEQNLGPVPESILKYHQESLIEPDILDNVNILNFRDDDSNPLTEDLPEILPSLPGIVKDVSLIRDDSKFAVGESFITNTPNSLDDPLGDNQYFFSPSLQHNLPPPPPPTFLPKMNQFGDSSSVYSHQVGPSSLTSSIYSESQGATNHVEQVSNLSGRNASRFLNQFEHLFNPIDSLPQPEMFMNSAESQTRQQDQPYASGTVMY